MEKNTVNQGIPKWHCAREIEENPKCLLQCNYCKDYFKELDNPQSNQVDIGGEKEFYPLVVCNRKGEKILSIMTKPQNEIIFRGKIISEEDFITILEKIEN